MKPYQIAYNAFMNLAYGIAQRNNGKFFIMDARVLSNFKDWGGEQAAQKAMTIAKELGWLPIDPSASNLAGGGQFNQFAVHDLDESDKVSRLVQLAVTFEEQGFKQIGITPQRQGQVQASETATGVTASINNSYSVTEPYFENFYNYKRRKLKMLLDLAQYVASKEKDIILTYTTSDLGNAFIKTTGTEVMLRDLGVNVDNSQDAIQDLEFAKKIALQNNTTGLPMSALISMISLKSPKDIQKALEDAEDKLNQQKQAEQQHQQEMQQEQIKAAKEQQAQEQAFEAQQNQLDRENEIRRAMITSMGFDQDIQGNNMIDVVEQGKLAIDQSNQAFNQSVQTQQMVQGQLDSVRKHKLEKEKINLNQKQIDLKEKEIKSREQQERLKNQGIADQNKNQIELSNKKHESDMKIANKQLEMKDMESKTAEKIGKIKINLANIQVQKARQKPKK